MDVYSAAWVEEIGATWGELFSSGGSMTQAYFKPMLGSYLTQITIDQNDHINEPEVKEQKSKLPHAGSKGANILGQ